VTWRGRIVAAVLIAFAAAGAAVYLLRVTAIEVVGTSALSPSDILAASGLRGGERILWIRTGAVASRIASFPSVDAVDVGRTLPGTIVIRVTERHPAVTIAPGLAADDQGVVFQYPPTSFVPALVGWRGSTKPGSVLDGGSRAVLAALNRFPSELRGRVRRISLVGSVTMVLDDGTQILFGQPLDLDAKATAAAAVLADAARRHESLAYVDVRAPSTPAARDRTPPSPAPSPRPSPTG
jgi:cell division protein FtsQ